VTPWRLRAFRIVGVVLLLSGVAIAVSTIVATGWVYLAEAAVPPFVRTLASVPTGAGLLVIGLGLLALKAGRED